MIRVGMQMWDSTLKRKKMKFRNYPLKLSKLLIRGGRIFKKSKMNFIVEIRI